MTERALELSCRHTWSWWIKGMMPVEGPSGRERPLAAYRSNCTRCGLFRVITVEDGGEEPPVRPRTCERCFLPLDDPPGALRWPPALSRCCDARWPVQVSHDGDTCRLHRVCGTCGSELAEPLGR